MLNYVGNACYTGNLVMSTVVAGNAASCGSEDKYCSSRLECIGTSLYDAVTLVKERKLLADEEMIWRACIIKELVMVRDVVCCLSTDEFSGTKYLL